ncbi:hypothetical protein PEBR_42353 [Penicillium brasilianum]|uniref:Uncharacterized protein n=1 Tax=Penicillium brasilianum TaxID=104259 RepID=A0A1S9R7V4_PENBI|nr:hypothetical protein PEBR_42353 [Penicillium brasilianum]
MEAVLADSAARSREVYSVSAATPYAAPPEDARMPFTDERYLIDRRHATSDIGHARRKRDSDQYARRSRRTGTAPSDDSSPRNANPHTPQPSCPPQKRSSAGLVANFDTPETAFSGIHALLQRSIAYIAAAKDPVADATHCYDDPTLALGKIIQDAPVDDVTIYAIMSCFERKDWFANTKDFETNRAVRLIRPPRGKAAVIEAFGIRWIPLVSGRTLLIGEKLAKYFPYLLRTERLTSYDTVQIGRVTIPEQWDEGKDYIVVARPSHVNMMAPSDTELSLLSREGDTAYSRTVLENDAWPSMDMDPNHLVVIPPTDENGRIRIMPLKDVPGFRPTCMKNINPLDLSPCVIPGFDDLAQLPWTPENPMAPREKNDKPREPAQNTTDKRDSKTDDGTDNKKIASGKVAGPRTPDKKAGAKADKQKRMSSSLTPKSTPKKKQRVERNVYTLTAQKMESTEVDHAGSWELSPALSPEVNMAFLRDAAGSLTGEYHTLLNNVADAAGLINKYCLEQGWTETQAMGQADTKFGELVREYEVASQKCHDYLTEDISEHASHWRTAAIANYILVSMQYTKLAVNPAFRRPAIQDMAAFLAMNPSNCKPAADEEEEEEEELPDDSSDEFH